MNRVIDLLGEPCRLNGKIDCGRRPAACDTVKPGKGLQILAGRQVRVKRYFLRHEADPVECSPVSNRSAKNGDRTRFNSDPVTHRSDQCRLSGPVGSEQPEDLACGKVQCKAIQDLPLAVSDVQRIDLKHLPTVTERGRQDWTPSIIDVTCKYDVDELVQHRAVQAAFQQCVSGQGKVFLTRIPGAVCTGERGQGRFEPVLAHILSGGLQGAVLID